MYAKFTKEAEEEDFHDIALLFRVIADIEKAHEVRYRSLFDKNLTNTVFKKKRKLFRYAVSADISTKVPKLWD
jgi:rubrerythrin